MRRIQLKKTLNWTSRVKIPQTAVRIELTGVQGADPKVRVRSFGLESLSISHSEVEWAEANVVLEANRLSTSSFVRLAVGRVVEVRAKKGAQYLGTLDGFLTAEDVSFTIKVVSRTDGRILAEGKNLRADGEAAEREELLPVRSVDLKQELWRVAWNENGPVLQVNNRVHDHDGALTRDAYMKGSVAPAALRSVLVRYVLDEEQFDGDWRAPWAAFIDRLGMEPPPEDNDWTQALEWVDRAVEAFAERHAFKDRINDIAMPGGEA